jgi:hypothetical protein
MFYVKIHFMVIGCKLTIDHSSNFFFKSIDGVVCIFHTPLSRPNNDAVICILPLIMIGLF